MALSNSQYNEIMRDYDQTRLKNLRLLEERKDRIYKDIPALEEIDRQIRSINGGIIRMRLSGYDTGMEQEKLRQLRSSRYQLLEQKGYPKDSLEAGYDCPFCKDTGFIDGQKCRCFKRREIALLYRQSNLRKVLDKENFDTFTLEWYDNKTSEGGRSPQDQARIVRDVCYQMAHNFSSSRENLLLTGTAGTGKTFLTHCIAREVLDQCYSVIYLSAIELFDLFSRRSFRQSYTEEDELMYQHVFDCDLLIIDDLGTEAVNRFTITSLFQCINDRAREMLPVVISTNLSLKELRDTYSERIASRLMSEYRYLELFGDDIRLKIRFSRR